MHLKKCLILTKPCYIKLFDTFLKRFFTSRIKKANFFEEISPLLLLFQPSDGQCDSICLLLIGSRYAQERRFRTRLSKLCLFLPTQQYMLKKMHCQYICILLDVKTSLKMYNVISLSIFYRKTTKSKSQNFQTGKQRN